MESGDDAEGAALGVIADASDDAPVCELVFVRMNDDRIARRMLVETAVRLALAAPAMDQLDAGLGVLASMLGVGEENFDSTE